MSHEYEKLGAFYLGREVDSRSGAVTRDLLYDSRDLTTHGVIIGMTGSGKTGLGVGLIEEAAIDRIPVIAVDPKGDLGNLLLTFPSLSAEEFRPWISPDVARQQGMDLDAFAAQEAAVWRDGLASWGQDGERIRRLRDAAEFVVYTPGSNAGVAISVLRGFSAPPPELVEDADTFRERVASTVSGLLGLLGIEPDPIRSREHILLSAILDDAWRKGRSLDLGALIQAIQQPPFTRLGVMELESVFPSRDRFGLAMQMNALLASPGFQGWMEGEPLDIGSILYSNTGKPRVSIFSIAHLGDAERMFFVTMLLTNLLGWMRSQSGTTSLRAIVYMDEIFGFFPPVANPPTKGPMLTLLKQARAFGVGMVLATQNPVDLDYKGLGNTGTWWIGRLQTERDKMRVLEALEGAMTGSNPIPREELDRMLSGLGKRVFLQHNVHRGAPTLFTTRWTMSYLAGPLTLRQIREMGTGAKPPESDGRPSIGAGPARSFAGAAPAGPAASGSGTGTEAYRSGEPEPVESVRGGSGESDRRGSSTSRGALPARPILPSEIRQLFVPPVALATELVYHPGVLVAAEVRYSSARHGIDEGRRVSVLAELESGPVAFSADRARVVDLPVEMLETEPAEGAAFAALPGEGAQARSYDRWTKELVRWIQTTQPVTLLESKRHRLVSRPGESERDFRMRLADLGREARDAETDRLRKKYEARFRTVQERLRRAEQAAEKRSAQSKQAMLNTALTGLGAVIGAAAGGKGKRTGGGLLGAFLGGGTSRATSTIRNAGRAAQTRQDVAHAEETVEAARAQLADLEAEFQTELERVEISADAEEALEEVVVRPALNAIAVRTAALIWLPWGVSPSGDPAPLWR